jgi:hypothetical protein
MNFCTRCGSRLKAWEVHRACEIAAAEDAAWKPSKVAQNIKRDLSVEAAAPGTEHNRR